MVRPGLLALALLTTTVASGHWTDHPELPPWAQRGRLVWALHYATTTRSLVDLMASHHQTLIPGGSFDSPETAAYAASLGMRYMPYVCSRTFTTAEIARTPELADAMLLHPDGSEFLAYGNPARRYGCLFMPAWPAYVRERTRQVQDRPDTAAVFYDNVYVNDDHRPAAIAAWQTWARAQGLPPGDDMPRLREGELQAAARAFNAAALVDYYRGLREFNQQHDPPLLISPNLGSLPGYGMAIVEGGGADLVFCETMSHPPFERNAMRYKIGLASSHGRPTGILAYLPPKIGAQRGEKTWHEGMHSFFYPSSPLPEEFSLAVAEAAACGGSYIPAYNLFPSLPITDLTEPFCRRIHHALKQSYDFLEACGDLNTAGRPGSDLGVLYSSLTTLHNYRGQNLNALGDALSAAGLPYEVVCTADLPDGLAGLTTLVVPSLEYVDRETIEGLLAFVRGGGEVVLTGPFATTDPLGQTAEFASARELTAPLRLASLPLRDWQLDGFEPEGPTLVKVTGGTGTATHRFDGAAGRYRAYLSMMDENDGTSTWRLSAGERTVAEGRLDAEDNQHHWFTTEPFDLRPGDLLRLTVNADAGELGRTESFVLCADDAGGAALGNGRVRWWPTGLETLPARELAGLFATPVRLPSPGQVFVNLQRGAAGWSAIHLVNYDFRYEVAQPGLYASDDGSAEARVYFSGRPVVLRKRLAVPRPGEVHDPVLQVQVTTTADCDAELVLTLNGQPAGRLPMAGARGWQELPIDRARLRPENVIEVRAEGALDLNRWCQIGIDTDAAGGGSEFSEDGGATFTADDLSPDLKPQRGEFLIRIVDRRPDGAPDEPGNLVVNGGFDAVRVPHSETRLTIHPARDLQVVVSEPRPTPALLLAPDHAPQWLTGAAREGETSYTVPSLLVHGIVLRHPDRAVLAPYAARMQAAAPWAEAAPNEPLRAKVSGWEPYVGGFEIDRDAGHLRPGSLTCRNDSATDQRGAVQTIQVNQTVPGKLTVSAWSRAEAVSGPADAHYSVYIDATCTDGSVFHGRHAPFAVGTHGWHQATFVLDSPKPVASLRLFLLFRNHAGQVWFDDVSLSVAD